MIWSDTSKAETYKYSDDKGITCFTDNVKDIPEKYRKNAVLIREDDGKVVVAPPLQADKIDESLLPPKEKTKFIAEDITVPESIPQQPFPYKNVAILSSVFLATFILSFFLNGRTAKRVFGAASVASMLTLLVYVSVFFASKHMHSLKKSAFEMTDAMKKKEEQKAQAIQDVLGKEQSMP